MLVGKCRSRKLKLFYVHTNMFKENFLMKQHFLCFPIDKISLDRAIFVVDNYKNVFHFSVYSPKHVKLVSCTCLVVPFNLKIDSSHKKEV